MGKYISNKILKYNRSESRKTRRPPTPPYDYLSKSKKQHGIKEKKDSNSIHSNKGGIGSNSPNSPNNHNNVSQVSDSNYPQINTSTNQH